MARLRDIVYATLGFKQGVETFPIEKNRKMILWGKGAIPQIPPKDLFTICPLTSLSINQEWLVFTASDGNEIFVLFKYLLPDPFNLHDIFRCLEGTVFFPIFNDFKGAVLTDPF